jgi:uncharacterized protein
MPRAARADASAAMQTVPAPLALRNLRIEFLRRTGSTQTLRRRRGRRRGRYSDEVRCETDGPHCLVPRPLFGSSGRSHRGSLCTSLVRDPALRFRGEGASKVAVVKRKRGFAAMDPETRRAIASKGGRAAHAQGRAHEFTSEEARAAGTKGGRGVARDRQHMADIGRRGGQARANKAKKRRNDGGASRDRKGAPPGCAE